MKKTLAFYCFFILFACKKDKIPALLAPFDNGGKVGQIATNPNLAELSGMAAAAENLHGYWAHSDGGNPDKVFLLDSLGNLLGSNKLKNTSNKDWEDICAGPGPVSGKRYLYIGDIGDNQTGRDTVCVYRCIEPTVLNTDISGVEKIALRFPGGSANAETLMLDPVTLDLFIVTKESRARVFRAKFPYNPLAVNDLEQIAELGIEKATGGDISPDGTEVVIRNKATLFYWKRIQRESFDQIFARQAAELTLLDEPQGEAICFNLWATGVLTSSESAGSTVQPIHFYQKK